MSDAPTRSPRARRWWLVALQLVVAAVVATLVWRTAARHWDEFRMLDVPLHVQPGWVGASALAVFVTYGLQITSWRRVLAGWRQHIEFGAAARAWCVANLGRYVPGKIWSFAGAIVLAQRAGVDPVPAATSTVAVQAIGLGAGVTVTAIAIPGQASTLHLLLGGLIAAGTVTLLVWPPAAVRLGRLIRREAPLEPLPVPAAAAAFGFALAGWVTYGLAFWFLARGLLATPALGPLSASGMFALGYILGWVAIFAPGGVGVRELALVGLLTPTLGAGGALAVSVGSRLLLTVTEVAAAVAVLVVRPGAKGVAE